MNKIGGYMIRKRGFTLSEILISLTIVGVISAVTIPQLLKSVVKDQTGGILARTVAQLETGFQNVIQAANSHYADGSYAEVLSVISKDDLTNGNATGANAATDSIVFGSIPKQIYPFLGLTNIGTLKDSFKDIKSFAGQKDSSILALLIKASNKYKFSKSPASCYIRPIITSGAKDLNIEPDDSVYSVVIDINGFENAPNTWGKDLFLFYVKNNGKVVPYGADNYEEKCANNNVTDGKYCAAKIIADGWKIKYY